MEYPILFLDFDGVLHPTWPCKPAEAFAAVPRLLRVLDDFPAVDVVVSSSWRLLRHSKAWGEVPESLRSRITGHTPEIRRREHCMYPAGYTPPPIRFQEIQKYLKDSRQLDRHWVALDDDARLFPPACPQLILCEQGFGEVEAARLRGRLTP